MAAVLLTLGLFVFWVLVGYALLGLLRPGIAALSNLLLAPAVGIAATVLLIFLLNHAGLPVARCAWPATLGLVAMTGIMLWRLRPQVPLRKYRPFAAILLLGLFVTGRPVLEFGFDWLSYCNDDMANYSLMAQRLVDHGFYDIPSEEELISGRDYSQFYWFLHVPGMVRSGSDLLLAWTVSLTGLTPHQAFMPLILAFHLALLSAAAALVCTSEEQRLAALLTCALVALSALTTLGTIYQLIAQVAGLTLLAGCAAVLMQPLSSSSRGDVVRHGLLTGFLVTALLVIYPEVFPFLAIAFVLHLAMRLAQRELMLRPMMGVLGIGILTSLALLNTEIPTPFVFLLHQLGAGSRRSEELAGIFPYYMTPSGLADLWGLQPLTGSDVFVSAKIMIGAVLLAASVGAIARLARRLPPAATVAVTMLAVGAILLARRDPFGLFKLAMFIQPFLLATMVLGWFAVVRRPILRFAPLLLGVLGLPALNTYVEASRAKTSLYAEIPDASASRITTEFRREAQSKPLHHVLVDSCNYSLAKFQFLYLRGVEATCPAVTIFQDFEKEIFFEDQARYMSSAVRKATTSLLAAIDSRRRHDHFHLHAPDDPSAVNEIQSNELGRSSDRPSDYDHLIASAPRQTVLNRFRLAAETDRSFVIKPWREVSNHLVFAPSARGMHVFANYGNGKIQIALYRLEGDYFFGDKTVAACGRHLLFEVLNPSSKIRLLLAFTNSLKGDGVNQLPPAAAIGTDRQPFALMGRGSARLFSPPLEVQMVAGRPFVAIDMGVEGTRPGVPREGLMKLWGTDVPLDRRYVTGYARDISLVSDEEYARLVPPGQIAHFPHDLAHPGLEYSGLYEDGWISDSAWCTFAHPGGQAELVFRGDVPIIGDASFMSNLRVLVDGQEVGRRCLKAGESFDLRWSVSPQAGRRRVELHFSAMQPLPNGDGRPAAAHISKLGFETERAQSISAVDR